MNPEIPIKGNDLFREMMENVPEEFREITIAEWEQTPFMTDADFSGNDDVKMRQLYSIFGPQSSPMHRKTGDWRRSFVTLYGKSWIGFKTQELLDTFISRFPDMAIQNKNL